MWPRRKILFLIPQGTEEGQGILSLLEALHINVVVRETSGEVPADLTGLTNPGLERDIEDLSDGGPTEILYWPGIHGEDEYRKWGSTHGLSQVELSEFLHRFWEEEIILPVSSNVLFEGMPLLSKLLEAADFTPSLFWKRREGQWAVQMSQGLYWVVSKEWLHACCGQESFGREPERIFPESRWLLQDDRVDFYQDRESCIYLGSLERYCDRCVEEEVYDTVLQALRLGVPWKTISIVLKPLLKNPRDDILSQEKNLRWYVDEIKRDTGSGRSELPPEEFEYLENRGIS